MLARPYAHIRMSVCTWVCLFDMFLFVLLLMQRLSPFESCVQGSYRSSDIFSGNTAFLFSLTTRQHYCSMSA